MVVYVCDSWGYVIPSFNTQSLKTIRLCSVKSDRWYSGDGYSFSAVVVSSYSGGGQLSDLSFCLLHGPDSGQPFLCEPQSSGHQW